MEGNVGFVRARPKQHHTVIPMSRACISALVLFCNCAVLKPSWTVYIALLPRRRERQAAVSCPCLYLFVTRNAQPKLDCQVRVVSVLFVFRVNGDPPSLSRHADPSCLLLVCFVLFVFVCFACFFFSVEISPLETALVARASTERSLPTKISS